VDIDVEVNLLDTDLVLAMPAAFMPAALAHLRIFDLRKPKNFQSLPATSLGCSDRQIGRRELFAPAAACHDDWGK